jgi:hypothetical protein
MLCSSALATSIDLSKVSSEGALVPAEWLATTLDFSVTENILTLKVSNKTPSEDGPAFDIVSIFLTPLIRLQV